MQDRKNVVLNNEEVSDTMGSKADVEQTDEILPDTQIAQKEFSQWNIGLFTGRKTFNDEKYALLTSRRQPVKNYQFPGVVQVKTKRYLNEVLPRYK